MIYDYYCFQMILATNFAYLGPSLEQIASRSTEENGHNQHFYEGRFYEWQFFLSMAAGPFLKARLCYC